MTAVRHSRTTFGGGEVTPLAGGRQDLRTYETSARQARNVLVLPWGAVRRRPGMRRVAALTGPAVAIPFEFNVEQTYLILVLFNELRAYANDALVWSGTGPWTEAQVDNLAWAQSADTLLVAHPDVPLKRITRTGATTFTVSDVTFVTDDATGRLQVPHHKFAADAVTLAADANSGACTLTASAPVFVAGHVGTRFRRKNFELQITGYISPTQASALCIQGQFNTAATKDWTEQAWSAVRGYPTTVTFHQDRLVIGGSRDLPSWLWMSKSADYFNFDLGTGLDDESIQFPILADQVDAIRAVHSEVTLQVFTSGGEWVVTSDVLTPSKIILDRQTTVGSRTDRVVSPVSVGGVTMFAPRNGLGLRQFEYTDARAAWVETDAALMAPHLVRTPRRLAYDPVRRLVLCANEDGTVAAFTVYRPEQVAAWALWNTSGLVRDLAVIECCVYALVNRGGAWALEAFDDDLNTDGGVLAEDTEGALIGLLWQDDNKVVWLDGTGVALRDEEVLPGLLQGVAWQDSNKAVWLDGSGVAGNG